MTGGVDGRDDPHFRKILKCHVKMRNLHPFQPSDDLNLAHLRKQTETIVRRRFEKELINYSDLFLVHIVAVGFLEPKLAF